MGDRESLAGVGGVVVGCTDKIEID